MTSDYRLVRIGRQFTIFTGVGLVVIAVHYGMLVALVESGLFEPERPILRPMLPAASSHTY